MKEQIKEFNKLVEENNLDLQLVGSNPLLYTKKRWIYYNIHKRWKCNRVI
ncbi:hypothetical protein EMELA_v1c03700 [Mesoplasma melaleucae]|uniref:Uncharacterized protein n=1 Tax=Mesoplasma melaleucae TaxID=81459 RepID=A0A2K8NVR8_9MOLU|nr:hypothetical protein EMELA_v1c03700 [Mesoplasma melaleucae]